MLNFYVHSPYNFTHNYILLSLISLFFPSFTLFPLTSPPPLLPQVRGMQEELTALEPELKRKSAETEELMKRLTVDQQQANEVGGRGGSEGREERRGEEGRG